MLAWVQYLGVRTRVPPSMQHGRCGVRDLSALPAHHPMLWSLVWLGFSPDGNLLVPYLPNLTY